MTNKKEFFILSVLTFIVICAWVFFHIRHVRSQVEIPSDLKEIMKPLKPDFKIDKVEENL
jgi:hypothetical protein